MNNIYKRYPVITLALFTVVLTVIALVAVSARATRAAPAADPDPLLAGVTDYVIQAPKLYYLFNPPCALIQSSAQTGGADVTQYIGRSAVHGAEPRRLYEFSYDEFCTTTQPDIMSNIVSDSDAVYWLSRVAGGIVRLPESALLGDTPELVSAQSVERSELLLVDDNFYLLNTGALSDGLFRIDKTTGATTPLLTGAQVGELPNNFQSDGVYLYWRYRDGTTWMLQRYRLSTGVNDDIAGNVFSYFPVAGNVVYVGQEDEIRRYDHSSGSLSSPIFTTSVNALITGLVADAGNIYFIQQQQCTPACPGAYALNRIPISGGTATPLYTLSLDPVRTLFNLQQHDNYLFFLRSDGLDRELLRIQKNADSAELTNLRITDIEVTQAVQDNANSVPLIQDKRTAVRVVVQSDGDAIPGVYARLYQLDAAGTTIAGPLRPINLTSDSAYLRVQPTPDRDNINHSYLFFLPSDWVDGTTLRLRAELNPFRFPPEPTYTDNTRITSNFTLQESPRLETHFVLFEYESGGDRFAPRFRPRIQRMFDPELGGNVDGTDRTPHCECRRSSPGLSAATCRDVLGDDFATMYQQGIDDDLCAAWYVVCPAFDTIRATEGLPDSIMLYGMVADDAGFPRGWACGGGVMGPSGPTPGRLGGTWDIDGTYADWYAAHEIGHGAGRGHPSSGNVCGHSASDDDYPYANADIGPATLRGFDVGDRGLNSQLRPRIYPSNVWNDVMSYCSNQWISDYTYEGILSNLSSFASSQTTAAQSQGGNQPFLQLSGLVTAEANEAYLAQVRLWDPFIGSPTNPGQGNYRIRLLSGDSELAGYDFMPRPGEDNDDSGTLYISEFVPFVNGTDRVQIIRKRPETLLWERTVSPNAPAVANVQVTNGTSPLTGAITLQWEASDADNDPLRYDLLYSPNGGQTWQLLILDQTASTATIDTADLAGSADARFKVIANDGINQGEGVSQSVAVTDKAPVVTILTPADESQRAYGQPVTFAVEIVDVQDSTIPDAQIEWRNEDDELLGTGSVLATADFRIGVNEITVTATNSRGLTGSDTVQVNIEDDLALPGPTLAVWPDTVGWHVAEGETAVQMGQVVVNNVGAGSLAVTASADAPWLTVTTAGDTTPVTIGLSADPSQLAAGEAISATLQIVGTTDGESQSRTVPVTLAKGKTWLPVAEPETDKVIYLPVIVR